MNDAAENSPCEGRQARASEALGAWEGADKVANAFLSRISVLTAYAPPEGEDPDEEITAALKDLGGTLDLFIERHIALIRKLSAEQRALRSEAFHAVR